MWPGLNSVPVPYVGWVCCWFSSCSKGFSLGSLVFLSPEEPTFPNSKLTWIVDLSEIGYQLDRASSLNIVGNLFIIYQNAGRTWQ